MNDEILMLHVGVSDLVANFRNALVAVLPFADQVMMGHEDEEMHHDWEKLAACMFDVFVRGPLEVVS